MSNITLRQQTAQNRLKITGFLLSAVFGTILALSAVAGAETLSYSLHSGPFAASKDNRGYDSMSIDGFRLRGAPGNPLLPVNEYRILLPPDADFSTVRVNVVNLVREELPGTFEIRPAAPDSALIKGEIVEDWAGARNITGGRNMDVYGANSFFPAEVIQRAPNAQIRKYRFLRVEFHPVQYNPVTKQLIYTSSAVIDIEFEHKPEKASALNLKDSVLDKEAPGLFFNYEDAKPWYAPSKKEGDDQKGDMGSYNMVIITTNAIKSGSSKLDDFVASKRQRGYSVLVITESQYNGYSGTERADKIRNWLKSKYLTYSITYVLLIGDPTPGGTGTAAVPMKTCLPKVTDGTYYTPTDMYYSDLSGDWDGDNDGTYGEWSDYKDHGDPDLYTEVRVGRIPVYSYNYTNLDSILQKIINYQNTTASITWRDSVLLPMSFSKAGYDGAPLAEQLWVDYLNGWGFSRYRMYQQGNGKCGDNSIYASDWELLNNRVRDHWQYNDYGIVCWWGHGSSTSASVGYDGCWDGTLFSTSQCAVLDNSHPAVVFQNSCTNGYPETTTNLGYSLLLNGAIGTYSASRSSWFNTGVGYGDFDGSSTNSGIAYEVTWRVANQYLLGSALFYGKQAVIPDIGTGDTRLMNQYDFNLYGDPVLSIHDKDTGYICQNLRDALDNYSHSFSRSGDALWFCQQTYSSAPGGSDAAQSGDITNSQNSYFSTQVTGPGMLEFYWKVSSELNYDFLRFYDNNVEKYNITGNVDWHKKTYKVSSGTHTLKWSYTKDICAYAGMDCGWVDYVVFSPGSAGATPCINLLLLNN